MLLKGLHGNGHNFGYGTPFSAFDLSNRSLGGGAQHIRRRSGLTPF